MADKYSKSLTEEQRRKLKPTLDKIEQGFEELSSVLTEIGRTPSEEPGEFGCFFCGCPSYVRGGTPPRNACARPTCGHSRLAHLV
jgi:hypothetical protein